MSPADKARTKEKQEMRIREYATALAVVSAISMLLGLFLYISAQQSPNLVFPKGAFQPWLTITGGLSISALFAAYIAATRKRTRQIESLAEERTAQLMTSEGNLKNLLHEALDGIITIDGQGIIELANPAAQHMFGYRDKELIGENIKILMPEPHHSSHSNYISDYTRTGDAKIIGKSLELNARRKDGSEIPIRLSVNEYKIEGVRKFVGTLQDLTEHNQILETLRIRNDAIETSSDGISIADLDGNILYANKAMVRMWGYDSAEEVLGGSSYLHWADEKEARRVAKGMQTAGSWSGEIIAKRKDGSTFPVGLSAHTATDKNGNPLCLMASCRDNTERKRTEKEIAKYQEHLQTLVGERTNELQRANESLKEEIAERQRSEEAVRESEAQLRLVADSVPALIAYVDAEMRYRFNNALHAEWLNLSPQECIGKYVWEVIGKTPYEEVREHIDGALRGREVSFEQEFPLPGGAVRHTQVHYVPHIDSDGTVQGFFALATDVSAQKQMEESHRQAQRLEALGTLAGGIAHDFNNLLGAIIGFTLMAYEGADSNEQLREDLDEVLSASNRARDLVGQILAFSRQKKENHTPNQLSPIMEEAVRLLEATIPPSIEISTEIDQQCPPVLADASQIHQVVMNLATNAFQAMKNEGGQLYMGLDHVIVDSELTAQEPNLTEGSYARIIVRDTGHGIPRDEIDRIYDPFFTTKETGEGTGLGLSTVHGIVQAHEGAITVQSEEGKGTTFSVYLPCTPLQVEIKPTDQAIAPRGNERILIVEDEAPLLRFAERSLTRLGYRITTFQSSREAIEAFHSRPEDFDLIISDLSMPQMDGEELSRQAMLVRQDVPIILVTGFSETMTAEAAEQIGIRKLLSKPYSIHTLAEAVREAFATSP